MRLATILDEGRPVVAVVRRGPLPDTRHRTRRLGASIREIAARGTDGLHRIAAWVDAQPQDARSAARCRRPLRRRSRTPARSTRSAANYRAAGEPVSTRPARPLIYGKAASSVAGHGAVLRWDRSLTANVDAECELGVVIGATATDVALEDAMAHVFGYTCINDVSSRDAWLDGDQWLLGKSMAGFCPVGPWVVTADELDPADLRLGCTIDGVAIQDGRTSRMRTSIAEVIAYLSRHVDAAARRPHRHRHAGPARRPPRPGPASRGRRPS